MRILLFGDGAWAANSLKRLVREGWTLLGVVVRARPTGPELQAAAKDLQLPILQPQSVNDPEFVVRVAGLRGDLNLSISYDQILRSPILETARLGFVNFHAGKLPYYRGRNVINWAIINGETEIGLTAHYMDEGIDTGDLILQRSLPVTWTDTYGDILLNAVSAFPDLVADTVNLISTGKAERLPQAHVPGTYFGGRRHGDEWLDWRDSSRNLHNKIRGITHPGPGARTLLGDQEVIIWRAFFDPGWPIYMATHGEVVGCRPAEGVLVKTGDSTLLVQEVQACNGKARIPSWRIGTRLGTNIFAYLQQLQARVETLERAELKAEES